jgi:uncharacterized protein YwgA
MNRLQLATLLSWAGDSGLPGRKRLQKVVYFLQEAGCPLNCRYTIHYFGPYSRDVADACDEMYAAGLVDETPRPFNGGTQYTYALEPAIRKLLEHTRDEQMQRFESLGRDLIKEHIWTLELGSTILFYYCQGGNWEHALTNACEFKKVPPTAKLSLAALALAKRFEALAGN